MAWVVGTSTAATRATSITYGSPRGFGEVVAIGFGYNYRCRSTSTSTTIALVSNFNPKLLIHPCKSTSRDRYCNEANKVGVIRAAEAEAMAATEISGIKIIKNPPEFKLTELDVRSWPKWGCPPSKFPWTYSSKETCYLLKGTVKVYPDGSDEVVEFGAGDLVEFPKGLSCTWDVSEAVDKHYKFE